MCLHECEKGRCQVRGRRDARVLWSVPQELGQPATYLPQPCLVQLRQQTQHCCQDGSLGGEGERGDQRGVRVGGGLERSEGGRGISEGGRGIREE